jgi:5-methylcytosine-specific restriction endonuclease McrA
MLKKCKKCGNEFPATEEFFYVHKECKDGFRPECKACRIKIVKNFYKENNNKILEQKKEYHIKNRDKICAIKKEYNKINSSKRSKWGKKYYIENKDLLNKKSKDYYYSNPERSRYYAKKSKHKRRTLEKQIETNFSFNEWRFCKEHFDYKCAYCGKEQPLTQDHFIPLSKGGEYTKNNIIPCCSICNSSKCNSDFFEWYPMKSFYDKKKERKILKYLNYDTKTKIQQLALSI